MRKLNARFLLLLVAGIAVVGTGTFVVHWFQSGSIARALLWQAGRAETDGRLGEAAKYLGRYLEFKPRDAAERAHLAEILASDKLAAPRRTREHALFQLEQVLLREPERHDSRRLLARLALQLRRPELAQEHLKVLHKAQPDDGELERMQAQCHEALNQPAEAVIWYRKAVQHAPRELDNYVRLAGLLRQPLDPLRAEQRTREADEIMDQLVAANARTFRAYLARWHYRKTHSGATRTDVEEALRLAPAEADVLLAAADLALEEKDHEQARQHLRRGLELHARDARFYQALAVVELASERPEQAIAELRKGMQELRGQAQYDLQWTLANVLFDRKQLREADAVVAQMRQASAAPATLDYLHARRFILQGQWSEAARVLERTRPQLETSPELARQVDQFLGQCYEQLAEPGRQLDVLKRVVQAHPTSAPARLRLIAAHQAAGRVEDAVAEYRELLKLPDAPADAWTELARLLTARQAQRGTRDWKEADDALRRAEQANAALDKFTVARAELLAAQGKMPEARALLDKARDTSKSAELWIVAAALAERDGKAEEVNRLLDEAVQQCGDKVELRLARISCAVERRDPDAEAVLRQAEQALANFTATDHTRLLYGLAEAHYRLGRKPEAQRLWGQLAEKPEYRNDVRLRLFLFDLALQAGDDAAMDRILAEVQRIDGQQGPFQNYCAATRLIAKGRKNDPARLEEARVHLDAAAAQRPNWSTLLLAKGDLEELLNNPKQALANYRRALELGERHPRFVRRLVELLNREQQYTEAEQLIRTMQQQALLTPELQRVAVETLVRGGDLGRALSLLGQLRLTDSADYKDHLWQGQVLASSGQRAQEAESHFRKATELAADVPEVWVALVQHLARVNRKADAESVLASVPKTLKAKQVPLTLAQCHDALGRYDAAREQYQAALAARPDDPAVTRLAAGFELRWNRAKEAEPLLRALVEGKVKASDADVAWARRGLAMVLAAGGDVRQLPKALEMVGLYLDREGNLIEAAPRGAASLEERYAQARVLATQNRRTFRTRAIALLEELNQRQNLSPEDLFLLARLYEDDSASPSRAKARDLLRRLTAGPAAQPAYLAYYGVTLLRLNQLDEAQQVIDALAKLEKGQGTDLGSVELRARLLEARGDGGKAVQMLEEHVVRHAAKPEKVFALVEALARQNRAREALDRCEPTWQSCPPEMVAAASLGVLRLAKPANADYDRVEQALQTACAKHPASVGLRMHLARLFEMREQFAKAEVLYREVLQREPDNVVALNNLAWLLAQEPAKSAEASALVERAINRVGPVANLLDTRGAVYLSQNRAALAVADLEAATADSPAPPSYFRLARAHQMANRRDAAMAAFQKARAGGLDPRHLHPAERGVYLQMVWDFEQR